MRVTRVPRPLIPELLVQFDKVKFLRGGRCLLCRHASRCGQSLDRVGAKTAPADAKPAKTKLTMQKLKEMKAKWSANRPKLKACRKEVKAKGLAGDDRWFYIADCMDKT